MCVIFEEKNFLFQAEYYPQSITETVFDLAPSVRATSENFLERMWAYLTIKDLLEKVAKGEMYSCARHAGEKGPDVSPDKDIPQRRKRSVSGRRRAAGDYNFLHQDDEDYSHYEGSGDGGDSEEEDEEEYYYEDKGDGTDHDDGGDVGDIMEKVMEEVGDQDIVICNNLERALFLSLKYEFVTPLTSLVVVKPDRGKEEGDFGELGPPSNIRLLSSACSSSPSGPLFLLGILIFKFGELLP